MRSLQKDLGVGIGLRSPHYPHFLKSAPRSVDWVEVITEGFLPWEVGQPIQPLDILLRVRQNLPVVLHGVSLSIGSADPLDWDYLHRWKELIQIVEPAWVSDHLCWTALEGENFHDLLPLPYTEATLQWVVQRIGTIQEFLGRQILIENVSSYVECTESEMPEWEFLRAVSERADCGILLDVNNIFVSSRNHGFDPIAYLKGIPPERVGQIHLAGHSDLGTHLIDTHDAPICEAVWDLYNWVVKHYPAISVMIERDDNIPQFEELELELQRAATLRGAFETPDNLSTPLPDAVAETVSHRA